MNQDGTGTDEVSMIDGFIRQVKWLLGLSVALPAAISVSSRVLSGSTLLCAESVWDEVPVMLATSIACLAAWILLVRGASWLHRASRGQERFMNALPPRFVDAAIVASAGVGLLLELSLIRYQTGEFPLLALYKNLTLMACLAGLGIGFTLSRRAPLPVALVSLLMGWQFAFTIILKRYMTSEQLWSIRATPTWEQFNMGLPVVRSISQQGILHLFLGLVFWMTALSLVPVGQFCGAMMERRPRLRAYGLNLLGSVAGIILLAFLSSRCTPPLIWFTAGFLVLVPVVLVARRAVLPAFCGMLVAVILLGWPTSMGVERVYSPYQLVERTQNSRGWMKLRSAGLYHQQVHDLSHVNSSNPSDAPLIALRDYYDLPYRMHRNPRRVAVIGAGTGNDVAAALRAGADQVVAVEIDPVILELGTLYHPEKPYDDRRVLAVVDDARAWLRGTRETYDLIVYGLLDSHTLLSHASQVRLESFVYTAEAFREARARLNPGGLLVLSFCTVSEEIGRKLYLMLQSAFDGQAPVCLDGGYDGGQVFVSGSGLGGTANEAATLPSMSAPSSDVPGTIHDLTSYDVQVIHAVDPSTDDWPFFYIPRRVFPWSLVGLLALAIGVCMVMFRQWETPRPGRAEIPFFLLGAGFMLIETKAITEAALSFGNTWQVTGLVITGVLFMSFLANVITARCPTVRSGVVLSFLVAVLLVGWLLAKTRFLPATPWGRVSTVVVLSLPVFFSGMVFSGHLRNAQSTSQAMAANLFGAVLGGFLEYLAMLTGYGALYPLAALLFIGAVASGQRIGVAVGDPVGPWVTPRSSPIKGATVMGQEAAPALGCPA